MVRDGAILPGYFKEREKRRAEWAPKDDEPDDEAQEHAERLARLREEIQGKDFDRIVSSWLEERYQIFKRLGGDQVDR